ncbi:MAG: relaxase/mobilization nuclease domain-containing protein [Alphaproteobacteria bacterium]|nr:relaxase/mobilization nuclease domain-containing protein [Alphaproteobacteria bacterium]
MIIKSVIRGGYRSAAAYMKDQGKNEKTRLVELSDPSAHNLDDAFQNMWGVAYKTKCTKPLHHISINPMKGERVTDKQVLAIVERCEEKYGYKMFHHQRVIVEHVKDGRQHFHVIWNRVSLYSGRPVWPGKHWNKSKEVCREMEKELGLRSPGPRKTKGTGRRQRTFSGSKKHSGHPRLGNQTRNTGYLPINVFHSPGHTKPILLKVLPIPEPSPQTPFRPERPSGGWPLAAVLDWELWGHRNPRRFFTLWPELAQ